MSLEFSIDSEGRTITVTNPSEGHESCSGEWIPYSVELAPEHVRLLGGN